MWYASRRTLVGRGIVTVGFGVLLMAWPAISLQVLVLLFGAFALVDGVLVFATAAAAHKGTPGRSIALLAGALAAVVGILTFLWPGLTQLGLLVLIALRAVILGTLELTAAAYIGRHTSAGAMATSLIAGVGLLSIAFGVLLLVYPGTGLLTLVWVVGLYASALGVITIAKALVTPPSTPSMTSAMPAHR